MNELVSTDIDFEADRETQAYFTEGQCHALAYEVHKLTGWTIAMLSDLPVGSPDYMGHIFNIDSDGMAIDIKGRRSLETLKEEWYFCQHVHRFFAVKDFEYEMLDWDMHPKFDKDKHAKEWAKYIVDIINMSF